MSSILQNYNLTKVDFEKELDKFTSLSDEELKIMLLKLNPQLHNTTDLTDRERIIKAIAVSKSYINKNELSDINSFTIGVNLSRDEIKRKITARLKKRLDEEGMIDEVKSLMDSGVSYEK